MIRTRNFLLYVGVLLFLISAISVTVTHDFIAARTQPADQLALVVSKEMTPRVVPSSSDDTRGAYIESMRAKLARGEGKIPGAPVVLASEMSTEQPPSADPVTSRTIMWCSDLRQTDEVLKSWDPSSVAIKVVEGARIVSRMVSGQDIEAEATAEPLLQLAIRHVRALEDTCIPSDIVGVANDGTFILNGDAIRFQNTSANVQIGYALDGFPIYGVMPGDTLDACGGSDIGAGYQYHIRADEDFVLGCFAAAPAQFIQ